MFLETEVREPRDIDFDDLDADITVLAHQPGVGKTHAVMEYMKTHPDAFYFTDRHDTINEIIADMDISDYEYSHWQGFKRICEWRHAREGKSKYGLPVAVWCRLCNRTNCRYKRQFNERERVFAPYEHLKTRHIKPYPRVAFFDENKLDIETLSFDKKSVVDWMRTIDIDEGMVRQLKKGDFTSSKRYRLGRSDVVARHHETLTAAYENDVPDKKMQRLLSHSAQEIWNYFDWARKYDDYESDYHIPIYYHGFELAQEGVPLVFLDATFHRKFFRFLLEAYNGEIGFNRDITVKIYKSAEENKNTNVYALRPRNRRPRQSFRYRRDINEWLIPDLNHIKRIFGAGNVGIIGHKNVVGYALINREYYGNLRSSNKLADKDALVILGTYEISEQDIQEDMAKLLYKPLKKIKENAYSRRSRKRRNGYTMHQESADGHMGGKNGSRGEPIYMGEWIQQLIFDNEMYQAYHRNRGLRNNRTIITYGLVPRKIDREFNVKKVYRNEEEEFWQNLEVQHPVGYVMRKLRAMVNDLEQGDAATPVARRYKIWKEGGRGPDNQAVDGLLRVYKRLKKQVKNQ